MDRSQSILVVADLFFSSKLTAMVEHLGYTAITSQTRDRILEICRQTPPRWVLLDLSLAQLDWRELIRALRSGDEPLSTPILAFTNHADKQSMAEARELGCDRVVSKGNIAANLPTLLGKPLNV